MRNTLRKIGVAATVGALALAGIAATSTPALAASSWSAQYTGADIAGVHGWGTFQYYAPAGTTYAQVFANVKDTAVDSKGARLYLRWERNDGVFQDAGYVSASGNGDIQNGTFRLPATQYYAFEVMECKTEAGATVWSTCGEYSRPE
ncbi:MULTISPECIES: hypothetical protein [unclassified Micromonospora]|uniref:hypothetical protein n=1 Tax=unclassified Micromonospora TaxID=2617518 RepID=UPI0022BE75A4|nr:hypothetical protein [Micromonospora sp. AKA38]GHJ12852.1 hypothetical protein TPA0908_08470 [Micromonospora sp. AKA38]